MNSSGHTMFRFCVFLSLLVLGSCESLKYRGPFYLWGPGELNGLKSAALEPIDESTLISVYEKMKSVVIFVVNPSDRINGVNYPELKNLMEKNNLVYLPQLEIPHPAGDAAKVYVIPLSGLPAAQDLEAKTTFERIEETVGKGSVFGILATKETDYDLRRKREAEDSSTTTSATPTEEPMKEDFIYSAEGKTILYTTSAPILTVSNSTNEPIMKELAEHGFVTVDERDQFQRLIVTFKTEEGKSTLRFRFPISLGYWSLTSVEVEDKDFSGVLPVVGEPPSAPIGFSHKCSRLLVFRNGSTSLTMDNVQVQPLLSGATRFSDAYDCVGFTTVPIWSGIFVSFLVLFGTFVGIIALMEIKAPNRFESNRSKQLTFTVQE